jgi:hypothetical protein
MHGACPAFGVSTISEQWEELVDPSLETTRLTLVRVRVRAACSLQPAGAGALPSPLLPPVLVLVLGRSSSHSLIPLLPVCLAAAVIPLGESGVFVHSPSLGTAISKRRGDIPPDQKSQTSRDPTLSFRLACDPASSWLGGEINNQTKPNKQRTPLPVHRILGTFPWH